VSFCYLPTEAGTHDWAGARVQSLMEGRGPDTTILDVGPGWGKYRILLPWFGAMDAVEVFEPYLEHCRLRELYREVFVADVCAWVDSAEFRPYDVVIMGDVLEHIEARQAVQLLGKLTATCGEVIVVVPYGYEQGAEHGNEHQRHLQADLSPGVMSVRYPYLQRLAMEFRDGAPYKGLYWRRGRMA
jgi:hypothetical protein